MNEGRTVGWLTIDGLQAGQFIQFMAVMDGDNVIRPHALVEMSDGRVRILELDFVGDFRFLSQEEE